MIETESVKARIGVAMRIYLDNNNTELISVICKPMRQRNEGGKWNTEGRDASK